MERRTQENTAIGRDRFDPYRSKSKPGVTLQCEDCDAITEKGRWVRPAPPALRKAEYVPHMRGTKTLQAKKRTAPVSYQTATLEADKPVKKSLCPACQQVRDDYAGGVVELHGKDWREKAEMIESMIRNTEKVLRVRNDQERIMSIKDIRGVTKVYVTLPELARQIGRSLERSFKGLTEYHRSTEEPFLRVTWNADLPDEEGARDRHKGRSRARRRRGDKGALPGKRAKAA